MKLNRYIGLAAVVATLGFGSCKKDYLNTQPTDKVSGEVLFSSIDGARVALNGMHAYMNRSSAVFATARDDDFAQKAVDLTADLMGEDMVMEAPSAYGWFRSIYQYTDSRNPTSGDAPVLTWNFYYKIINNANNIINRIDAVPGTQADKNNIKGQALTYRAYAFYNLSIYFQHTYVGHQNDKGVILSLEPTTASTTPKSRATLQEVYAQITSDLKAALPLLTAAQSDKSQININVAKGIYARVALTMQDWNTAATMAKEARAPYSLMTPAQYKGGMNDVSSNVEVMWGSVRSDEQLNDMSIRSFFSHIDATSDGYAVVGMGKLISKKLYDQIPATDVRKQLFLAPGTEAYGLDVPYIQLKFRVPTAGSWAGTNSMFMRSAEMYLIQAEAEAHGAPGDAASTLKSLVITRDPSYVPSANILNDVLLQRRIELWGDGFRFGDIQRLKLPLDRTGSNHDAGTAIKLTLPVESNEFLFKIPQSEFDANKALTSADQNP